MPEIFVLIPVELYTMVACRHRKCFFATSGPQCCYNLKTLTKIIILAAYKKGTEGSIFSP
jgi:hypothetical protein